MSLSFWLVNPTQPPFFYKIKSREAIEIVINGFLEMAKECHSAIVFWKEACWRERQMKGTN